MIVSHALSSLNLESQGAACHPILALAPFALRGLDSKSVGDGFWLKLQQLPGIKEDRS
jgi:hypothetical protein